MTESGRSWQHGGMRPTAYRRNARGLRDRQAFEGVRMQAGALFAAGHTKQKSPVTRTLGVARQNVSRWHALWRKGGLQALRSAGPTGYAPRLSPEQLHAIDQALRQGARAHGFHTDHWILDRITTVIERLTGVAYHPGHTWKLLRHCTGYRLLRPARRAVERDEQPIARWWPRTGPRIRRNARRRRAVIVFWDESGASLLPVPRRTWAPRGRTRWSATTSSGSGSRWRPGCAMARAAAAPQLAFHHQVGAYDTDTLIGALEGLRRFLGG